MSETDIGALSRAIIDEFNDMAAVDERAQQEVASLGICRGERNVTRSSSYSR